MFSFFQTKADMVEEIPKEQKGIIRLVSKCKDKPDHLHERTYTLDKRGPAGACGAFSPIPYEKKTYLKTKNKKENNRKDVTTPFKQSDKCSLKIYNTEDINNQPIDIETQLNGANHEFEIIQHINQKKKYLKVRKPFKFLDEQTHQERVALPIEKVEGCDLIKLTESKSSPSSLSKKIELAISITKSIAELHDAGVIHRDLKPDNIMVDIHKNPITAKIIDFNLSILVDSTVVDTVGTTYYCSPEAFTGKVQTIKSDIYSLAHVLFAIFFEFSLREKKITIFQNIYNLIYDKSYQPEQTLTLSEFERTIIERELSNEEKGVVSLLKLMIASKPDDRLDSAKVLKILEALYEETLSAKAEEMQFQIDQILDELDGLGEFEAPEAAIQKELSPNSPLPMLVLDVEGTLIPGYDQSKLPNLDGLVPAIIDQKLAPILQQYKDKGWIIALATGTDGKNIQYYREQIESNKITQIDYFMPEGNCSDDDKVTKIKKYIEQMADGPTPIDETRIYFFDDGEGNVKRGNEANYHAYQVTNTKPLAVHLTELYNKLYPTLNEYDYKKFNQHMNLVNNTLNAPTLKNIEELSRASQKAMNKKSIFWKTLGVLTMLLGIGLLITGSLLIAASLGVLVTGIFSPLSFIGIGSGIGVMVGGAALVGVGATFFAHGVKTKPKNVVDGFTKTPAMSS